MILFYNIVYVYVCKTSDEKFGGCWRSFSWLGRTVHVIVDTTRSPVDGDAVSASGLVVSLLVISIFLGSSPPRTSGLSDNTGHLYPATSESVLFPSDEESENPCYYLRSFVSAKSQRHPTELPRSILRQPLAYQWRRVSYVTVFFKWRFP